MTTIIEEQALKTKHIKLRSLIIYIVLFSVLLSIGFAVGQFFAEKNKAIYVLDERKFFKFVGIGLAMDKGQQANHTQQEKLTAEDKEKLRKSMQKFAKVLKEEYKLYPFLLKRTRDILLRNNASAENDSAQVISTYEIYGETQKIDITNEVIIKIIGEEKWQEIGKIFLKSNA
jgi:hypothetical protein